MLAIFNSGLRARRHRRFKFLRPEIGLPSTFKTTLAIGFGCGLICTSFLAAERDSSVPSQSPMKREEKIFTEAESRFSNNPTNATATWQFARACFDLAERSLKDAQRAELAQ